ncbi:hypothetical protein E4P42_12525 [Mycobacterium sp. PS03-16]|uniref:hypothetical protein n=1 Tax=Mycobacterium sp. PS03-16 TaxID=2559611 RepID=UPI001073632D|nr:hypothetical protein [Mycobacterium sp. PS03-16]TFV58189.1 hypothetical protein E4P42_12525 [Mycobacterium sp. PS03-16]
MLDLETAEEVYSTLTSAWDTQVGAHAQWGDQDDALYFNRLDPDWVPYGVKVDITERREDRLEHTVYMVSPDGRAALSPCLRRIGIAQPGYGVLVPTNLIKRNRGASAEDGLYSTDTASGRSRLLISFADLMSNVGLKRRERDLSGGFYGFHTKWNPQGDRVMFIVRFAPDSGRVGKTENFLFTLAPDGRDVALALGPDEWEGGHHPNWCPDGRSIVMNLIHPRPASWRMSTSTLASRIARRIGLRYFPRARRLSFVSIDHRGEHKRIIAPSSVGSGHPTIDPSAKLLISDAYPSEEVAFKDGTVPIRGIDIASEVETCMLRVDTRPRYVGRNNEYRIDPHPAWDRSGNFITFNGSMNGCRSVFLADLSPIIDKLGSDS